ncbi:hypothetical protein E3G67_002322 [Mycobacteroides abscessus]|nr:hypothetical protein [Mycobacteroides abscessus]
MRQAALERGGGGRFDCGGRQVDSDYGMAASCQRQGKFGVSTTGVEYFSLYRPLLVDKCGVFGLWFPDVPCWPVALPVGVIPVDYVCHPLAPSLRYLRP